MGRKERGRGRGEREREGDKESGTHPSIKRRADSGLSFGLRSPHDSFFDNHSLSCSRGYRERGSATVVVGIGAAGAGREGVMEGIFRRGNIVQSSTDRFRVDLCVSERRSASYTFSYTSTTFPNRRKN